MLYVAAKLGIADLLVQGPQMSAALAAATGAEPGRLHRVLRGLASDDVLEEFPDGNFGLTPLGTCLRSDVPQSLHGAIIARGDLYFRAAAELFPAVRDGDVAFERAYGDTFFHYLSQHSELTDAFQGSMTDRSRMEAGDVVAAYDFSRFGRLVDVGGGRGILLEAILAATPSLQGVLFDRPEVVEAAKTRLATSDVATRCEFVDGDFFDSLPAGGDAYLLSRIIHDWDDAAALRILARCYEAMAEGATLLLVEGVMPELARDKPGAIRMDLHMLLLFEGRERTAAEFAALLEKTGFRKIRVVTTQSPVGLGIIEAVR